MVIRLSPDLSDTSTEKFPLASSRAAAPCATTCLTPEASDTRPFTVILPAVAWTPTPLVTEGEVITIFGAVVSLVDGLIGSVVTGVSVVFLIAVVSPEVFGRLPPDSCDGRTTAIFSPLNPAATR